jgi:hypothetical protein
MSATNGLWVLSYSLISSETWFQFLSRKVVSFLLLSELVRVHKAVEATIYTLRMPFKLGGEFEG